MRVVLCCGGREWNNQKKGEANQMTIEMIEKGRDYSIHVEDKPTRQNGAVFLQMLSHFDQFVYERPAWQNSIIKKAMFRSIA